ncbi:MAG: threonine/serine exporter family protein [bacterium]|nr:threonine/serine exporter family protein [bacterium]
MSNWFTATWLLRMQMFTFSDAIDLCLLLIGVILGIGASAVTFRIPPKELFWATAAGFLGWEVMYCLQYFDINTLTATTLGALAISLCSEFLARSRRVPASIYVVPGILPLVPGRAIYNAMFDTLNGQYELSETGTTQSMLGAGGIAIGLLIGTAIARGLVHPQHRQRTALEREQHRHLHSQQQLIREQQQDAAPQATERKNKRADNSRQVLHSSIIPAKRIPETDATASANETASSSARPSEAHQSQARKIHEHIASAHNKHQARSARYEKRRKR